MLVQPYVRTLINYFNMCFSTYVLIMGEFGTKDLDTVEEVLGKSDDYMPTLIIHKY